MNLESITRQYLDAKRSADAANKVLESSEAALKEALHTAGESVVEVDGTKVTMVVANRRSFDVAVLKDLVSAAVFRSVTVPTVKTNLLDAAIQLGKISPEVVEQVTSFNPYTQVRVK